MSDGGIIFQPPRWEDYDGKHLPDRSRAWDDLVRGTGSGKKVAKYHPQLTHEMIRAFELETLQVENGTGFEILPSPRTNVRLFWRELTDLGFQVGASLGEETAFILVKYDMTGSVHGYPITRADLRRKGVKI